MQVVKDLWVGREWNVKALKVHFPEEIVKEICNICIPLFDSEDSWSWSFSKDGWYSVRSAYNMLISIHICDQASSFDGKVLFDWKYVWHVNLPPKIKTFAWKALKNGIAAKSLLHVRGLTVDVVCPMCGEGEESIMHMLVKCKEVRLIWYASLLRLDVDDFTSNSFITWVSSIINLIKEKRWWDIFWSL